MCLDNLSIDFILLYSVKKSKVKLNFYNLRDANFACNMENYDLLAFLEIFQCREIRSKNGNYLELQKQMALCFQCMMHQLKSDLRELVMRVMRLFG